MSVLTMVFRKEFWTKELVAWYLYDFANSIFVVNAGLYLSQWVVVNQGLPDIAFGLPFVVATALLIVLSPYIGERGDCIRSHRTTFIISTLGAALSALGVFTAAISGSAVAALLALVCYGLFNLLYQLAIVPYSVFLKHISPGERYGMVSGIGVAANQLGYVAGILLTLPIIRALSDAPESARVAVLLPAALGFIVFSLPALFILKEPRSDEIWQSVSERVPFWSTLKTALKRAREYPSVVPFLIAYYFFSDALLSIQLYAAIYLQNVFDTPDSVKAKIYLMTIPAGVLGSYLSGIAADRWDRLKTLMLMLALTVVAIVFLAGAPSLSAAFLAFPLFGFGIGSVWGVSRAYFASLVPQGESGGRLFGLYAFSERAASTVGPLLWGLIVWLLASHAPANYRIAALAMAFMAAIGLVGLFFLKTRESSNK